MSIVSAAVSVRSKNFVKCIGPMKSDVFGIKLLSNKMYDIGLDQSSSCSGIAISSIDNDINVLIEVQNDLFDKNSFYRELKGIIRKLVRGQKIRTVVCEDPPPVKGKMYASRVLLELRGRVADWVEEIPEFIDAKFYSIYPQTWKSLVVNKTKGKNRGSDKSLIAEDVCDIIPEFNEYRLNYAAKSYDGFDAFGILMGYKKYAYTEDGLPLICGKQERRHTSFVGYRYVDESVIRDGTVNDFLGKAINILKPQFLLYNDRYNQFENTRMATSNWDCSYTIMPSKALEVLKWKYDLEIKDDCVLLAYFFNYSHYPQATKSYLRELFPMNEEVVTC